MPFEDRGGWICMHCDDVNGYYDKECLNCGLSHKVSVSMPPYRLPPKIIINEEKNESNNV